jgi:hypothetical protein
MDTLADPVAVLRGLTADDLKRRLDALESERRALAVLYRSARARERYKGGPEHYARDEEPAHA